MTLARKQFIKTFGCQMNVYDSVRMESLLTSIGYVSTEQPDEADIIVLNTCHIREKAADKIYSELGRLRRLQPEIDYVDGRRLIVVAGCVAQAEGEEIMARAPQVDIVLGPQTYHRLPELVEEVLQNDGNRALCVDFPKEDKFDHLPEESVSQGVSAYLTIQEGCDRFCSFCVVPYTRGSEQSRPAKAVFKEAKKMVAMGSREIVLLGQNVNAYNGEGTDGQDWGLGRLIRCLAEIEGLLRIRYTTSHPRDMDIDLIDAHRTVPTLMPYLHLPVQSGSDRILAAMNRDHTIDDYRRVVENLRVACPQLALSSDFIVGFPGESDQEFAKTIRLVNEINFAQAYSFKYSVRPGTPAAKFGQQIPDLIRKERLVSLQQILRAQQDSFNQSQTGKTLQILVEGSGRLKGQLVGRSPFLQPVHFNATPNWVGKIAKVRISQAHANSLRGSLVVGDEGYSTSTFRSESA